MTENKIFKENLTSKLLQKQALRVLMKLNKKNVCEIGCGDGNISNFLISNLKKTHYFHISDISKSAIIQAKKKIDYNNIIFKVGNLFSPWKKKKFDLVISDVSSLSQPVADKSPWYKGVTSDCGVDGLKNVNKLMKQINKYLKPDGILVIPLISLSNTIELKKKLKKKFKYLKESKRTYWPIPKFFKQNIRLFDKLLEKKIIYYEEKFGIYLAYTSIAICKKLKDNSVR